MIDVKLPEEFFYFLNKTLNAFTSFASFSGEELFFDASPAGFHLRNHLNFSNQFARKHL